MDLATVIPREKQGPLGKGVGMPVRAGGGSLGGAGICVLSFTSREETDRLVPAWEGLNPRDFLQGNVRTQHGSTTRALTGCWTPLNLAIPRLGCQNHSPRPVKAEKRGGRKRSSAGEGCCVQFVLLPAPKAASFSFSL